MRLSRSNTAHAPVAATVTAFSTYFTGLCIVSRFRLLGVGATAYPWVRLLPAPHPGDVASYVST